MTGHQINSLVGDLVAMAQAMERLPEVERERDGYKAQNESLHDVVQRLEVKLMDAKNLEDSLRTAIRDLEVARDDAELRFLEADDKLAKFAEVFQVALEAMDTVDRTVTDLTVKPVEPIPSEVKPIAVDPTHTEPAGPTEGSSTGPLAEDGDTSPQGSMSSDPTAHGSDGNTQGSETAPSTTANEPEPVAAKPWWEQDVKPF